MHILQILGCRTYFVLRMLLLTTIALISASVAQISFAQSLHISSLNIRISETLINNKVSLGLKKSNIVELPEHLQLSFFTTFGLKKLPILGKLFQDHDFLESESELAVIATPHPVKAVSEKKLTKLNDGFLPEAGNKRYLTGRLNCVNGDAVVDQPGTINTASDFTRIRIGA